MPRRKKQKRQVRQAGENVINASVQKGIEAIIERHSRFRDKEEFILRHISQRKLNHALGEINEYIEKRERERGELSEEEKADIINKNLADYVSTGKAFDEAGKELILKGSLEERAKSRWSGGFARRILKGEKYLDEVMEAFSDLYSLFKSGDYAQRMPEVSEAVTTVYDMGFFNAALDVLSHYKLIDKGKYRLLKESIRKKTVEGVERARKGIEQYTSYKAAASILAVLGIGTLIISGVNITGNVIGSSFNNFTGILTGLLFLIAGFLVFKKKR